MGCRDPLSEKKYSEFVDVLKELADVLSEYDKVLSAEISA
jgi:hypothetical protein